MAATFHPFSRLAPELRAQIWGLAAAPRIVHIRITETLRNYSYASPIPPPAVIHVCQESRQHAPYQKAFFTTFPGEPETEVRYIWVNFQEDMICIADEKVERLAPHEADIQRLKFMVPNGDYGEMFYSYFFHNSNDMLEDFTALRELHLAIDEAFLIWGTTVGGTGYGGCPSKNVRFLDLYTGLLLTGPQLEMAYNWSWQDGGKVEDIDDFDEELQFMIENYGGIHLHGAMWQKIR